MAGLRGLFRTAVAIAAALVLSQEPEFARQYAQRLGGVVDEIERGLKVVSSEAEKLGLTLDQSIETRLASPDGLTQSDGKRFAHDRERARTLREHYGAIVDGTMWDRLRVVLFGMDWDIAVATASVYVPAMPLSVEGGVAAGVGLVGGWLAAFLLLLPFRRRAPRRGFSRAT